MIVQFRLRRGTAAEWSSANPVLAEGEPGLDTDGKVLKIGDGVLAWNSLPIFADDPATITAAATAAATAASAAAASAAAAAGAVSSEVTRATAAEATKAPIASPTFTGTVAGVTKSMVGLDSVDNTADASKPVSTAQAAAIASEASRATAAEVALQNLTNSTFTTGLNNAYARRWAANIAYTAGDTVLAPDGSLVKAKADFTSGVSYSASNWTTVNTSAGTQAQTELAATFEPKGRAVAMSIALGGI